MFLLCPSRAVADEPVEKLPGDRFAAMPSTQDDPKVIDRALGGGEDGAVVLRFWWD